LEEKKLTSFSTDLHPSKNISLYDQKGSKIPLSNKTNIDLSILPKGIYYIIVQDNNSRCFVKVAI
jgi:hypothetical protein